MWYRVGLHLCAATPSVLPACVRALVITYITVEVLEWHTDPACHLLCLQRTVSELSLPAAFQARSHCGMRGECRGFITSFKLSPNLRKPVPPPKPARGAAAPDPAALAASGQTPEQAAAAAAAAFEASRLDAIIDLALRGRAGLQPREP